MARGKRKTKAFQQGIAQTIYKYFISHMLRSKPQGKNMQDWLNEVFCVEDRTITRYVAKKDFKLSGLLWQQANRLIPSKKKTIYKGDEVWVRVDVTMPDRIDVETWSGQGGRGRHEIFAINRVELNRILPKLEEVPFRKFKRSKASWETV